MRLPKKFRFNTDEVIVQQLGDAVILVPKESLWQTFMAGLDGFTSRCFCRMEEIKVFRKREKICDLYAGHKYLHLCNEKISRRMCFKD